MAVVSVNGRPKSIRTFEEELADLEERMGSLSDDERHVAIALISQLRSGDSSAFDSIWSMDFEREPVDPRTFLTDEYYIGATGSNMWPKLMDDFEELFSGGYSECCLGGSIGYGKSFFSSCALAYVIYLMSCLRDPQSAYGLAPGSSILIALLSMTKEVARRVLLAELHAKIEQSTYFKEVFPFKYASTMYEIRFPKHITVVGGSTTSTVIGGNVFSAFIDESSFMGDSRILDPNGKVVSVDRGKQIHTGIMRRMKSRFQKVGKLPGVLFLASSKERPVAFVEERIKDARENQDRTVFVREYATWDVKPRDQFAPTSFRIAVGDGMTRSVIDPSDELAAHYEAHGMRVIEIPDNYRLDFELDLEGALRDVAGVATEAVSPFIHRVEKIGDAIQDDLPNPLDVTEWIAGNPLAFHWGRVSDTYKVKLPGGFEEMRWRAKRHPGVFRHIHIDPSLTGDSVGFAIGHIAGDVEVIRRDSLGVSYSELAPVIETDLLLSIHPPPGDEIFLGDLRAIVYQFEAHGFPVHKVTLDSYQSADSIQQFRQRGIESEVLSVDRTTEPYDVMKSALYEGRLRLLRNPVLIKEMQQLQRIPRVKNASKFKVDHPKAGTKDLADAVAGLVFSLSQDPPGQPIDPMKIGTHDDKDADGWVSGGTRVVRPKPEHRGPLPFVRG